MLVDSNGGSLANQACNIVINDIAIGQKLHIRLLRVTIDDQLLLSGHVYNVCRKASCQTQVLLR